MILQAVRTSDRAPNPVYVSVGHMISLDTAVRLVVACSRYRLPEPVRQVTAHQLCRLMQWTYIHVHVHVRTYIATGNPHEETTQFHSLENHCCYKYYYPTNNNTENPTIFH